MHIMHMKDYLLTDNTHVQGKYVYTNSTIFYVHELTVTISSHLTSSRIHIQQHANCGSKLQHNLHL